MSQPEAVQVRSSPNERTAGVLLGRIGLLLRVVAIAIALAITRRVAAPRPRRSLPQPERNPVAKQARTTDLESRPRRPRTRVSWPDRAVSRPSNKGEHPPSVPSRP